MKLSERRCYRVTVLIHSKDGGGEDAAQTWTWWTHSVVKTKTDNMLVRIQSSVCLWGADWFRGLVLGQTRSRLWCYGPIRSGSASDKHLINDQLLRVLSFQDESLMLAVCVNTSLCRWIWEKTLMRRLEKMNRGYLWHFKHFCAQDSWLKTRPACLSWTVLPVNGSGWVTVRVFWRLWARPYVSWSFCFNIVRSPNYDEVHFLPLEL